MTAEVIVMNTKAVAMAADSAVSIGNQSRVLQTHFSANKLFGLSYKHPVGIMIYQDIDIHNVPWETIIKMYREKLGEKRFDTLDDYAKDFIQYLKDESRALFSQEQQEADFKKVCHSMLHQLQMQIEDDWAISNMPAGERVKFINNWLININQLEEDIKARDNTAAKGNNLAATDVENVINFIKSSIDTSGFDRVVGKQNLDIVFNIVKLRFLRGFIPNYTGIVFAGYGEKNVFPCESSFVTHGFFFNKLYISIVAEKKVDNKKLVGVRAYAQTNMASMFMRGISEQHENVIMDKFIDDIVQMPAEIIDEITDLDEEQKEQWKKHFFNKSKEDINNMMDNMNKYIYNSHTKNIREGIKYLSKDDLADVAGAILKLSTIQKKISLGDDSVGGPIDVAVISKGDGFVWINRKHYFKGELNPHFFARFSNQNVPKSQNNHGA